MPGYYGLFKCCYISWGVDGFLSDIHRRIRLATGRLLQHLQGVDGQHVCAVQYVADGSDGGQSLRRGMSSAARTRLHQSTSNSLRPTGCVPPVCCSQRSTASTLRCGRQPVF